MSLGSSSGRKAQLGNGPEEQLLLSERGKSPANIVASTNGKMGEKQAFLAEPVRLTPAWEEASLPNDELNFKGVTMEQARLETNPPKDRFCIVYCILLLHGIGTLLPWNMFINAKEYFVDYKLSKNYTGVESDYAANFLPYLGIAAQGPNIIFNWLNIFVQLGGKLSTRIVWSIVIEMVIFVITVAMAMTDSSEWPGLFFWLTMLFVVILNMANGVYQNTVYGMAAKLPPKYTSVIVLGSNVSGTLSSVINIISLAMAPNPRTSAIYYFITALFFLSLCFDTYFALPLNRFYKYHELMSQKEQQRQNSGDSTKKVPFGKVFKQCYKQCLNVFLIFFVTLSVFPTVISDIKKADKDFIITDKYYVNVMCFLTFNLFAMIGSALGTVVAWPGPKYLWIPVVLRFVFLPLFLFCNYYPMGVDRILPVYIDNDYAYWGIGVLMAITSGYFSSIAMMYCPQGVDPEYAATACMFGAACIITGICAGITFSMVFPIIVSMVTF